MLGAFLIGARTRLGLSQRAVAMKAGISHQYYARLEQGLHYPSLKTLCRLGKSLHISKRDMGQLVRDLDDQAEVKPFVLVTRSLPLKEHHEED